MFEIKITKLEMLLILEESHPEYKSDFEDVFIERGKGADVHFERQVIRLSDNKSLTIGFTLNSDVGYQDWLRSGNFILCHDKADIYNEYGELIKVESEEKEKIEEPENNKSVQNNTQTIFDKYKVLKENGDISIDKDAWLNCPTESLIFLVNSCKAWFKDMKEHSLESVYDDFCKIAVDEKIDVDLLWREIFNNTKLTKSSISDIRLERYFENRKGYSKNKNHLMTVKDIEDLKKYSPKYLKLF